MSKPGHSACMAAELLMSANPGMPTLGLPLAVLAHHAPMHAPASNLNLPVLPTRLPSSLLPWRQSCLRELGHVPYMRMRRCCRHCSAFVHCTKVAQGLAAHFTSAF
jgi:hypothetical protein